MALHTHPTHHPDDDLLVAYASGDLDEAWSLLVATHLAVCPICRSRVEAAETVGGALLENIPTDDLADLSDDALERALERVAATPPDFVGERDGSGSLICKSTSTVTPVLPQPLRDYAGGDVGELEWRRLGSSAFHIPLVSGRGAPAARLLKIPGGTAVPEHGHNGLELTLVLAGSFVDDGERFARGDVETADTDLEHQPYAEAGSDCICLAVTDAPLRFRGPMARLVQPFIGI
ncbi:MAG: transcriptional regulator [Alphaproteobacteria bacterium]|nr:transcriptional regulator [Alphaproteobacteria bacterium]HCO99855.1 transcriptional regulator [Rhodospirillaceae bacterium]